MKSIWPSIDQRAAPAQVEKLAHIALLRLFIRTVALKL
jgi:hypothetical protein